MVIIAITTKRKQVAAIAEHHQGTFEKDRTEGQNLPLDCFVFSKSNIETSMDFVPESEQVCFSPS